MMSENIIGTIKNAEIKNGRIEAQGIYRRLFAIFDKSRKEFVEIFDDASLMYVMQNLTVDEIECKLNEFEKYKNRIKVGDELVWYSAENCHAIATRVSKDGKNISVVFDDGSTSDEEEADKWHKTGRHFDEVKLLIERMKEK